jgi:tRNA(fMet)-specific endonuclease VapC
MDYLLDTNICIHYFKGQFEIKNRFEQIGYHKIAISEITLAELIYGAEKSEKREKNIAVIDNFSEKVTIIPIFQSIKIYAKEPSHDQNSDTHANDYNFAITLKYL